MDGVVVEHEKGNFVKEEWPSSWSAWTWTNELK
jgi:hypothetical protein